MFYRGITLEVIVNNTRIMHERLDLHPICRLTSQYGWLGVTTNLSTSFVITRYEFTAAIAGPAAVASTLSLNEVC